MRHSANPSSTVVRSTHVVTLTEQERTDLTKLVRAGRVGARTILHAQVVLWTDAGPLGLHWTDEAIQAAFGIGLTAPDVAR